MALARLGMLVSVAFLAAKVSPGQATHLYGEDMEDTLGFSSSQETPQPELEIQMDEYLDDPASQETRQLELEIQID